MKKYLFISILLMTAGCSQHRVHIDENNMQVPIKEHAVLAVLWQVQSAEYKALCYQAFNFAKTRLDQLIEESETEKPLAIITDIDETILDNSPYAVQLINDDRSYDKESWLAWGKETSAQLIPGAADFLNHVHESGVEIFYISNRYEVQVNETIDNLKKHNLPNADINHMLLKTSDSGKETRRQKVFESHEVLLLLGDNLSDFHQVFDDKNSSQRNQAVFELAKQFGNRFIVFPNPTYGDWEQNGVYEGKRLSEEQKSKIRKSKLNKE